MPNTISEERKEDLQEMKTKLDNLSELIQNIIDGKSSMTDFAKKINITPQRLNTFTNRRDLRSIFNKIKILSNEDIEQLFRRGMSPAERLMEKIIYLENYIIVLDITEEENLLSILKEALTDREYDVIIRKYGFNGTPETFNHIAESYGMTPETIRQNAITALRKLRNPKWLRKLLPNYDLKITNLEENKIADYCNIQLHDDVNTITIDNLELSTRSYNCLRRGGFYTYEELSTITTNDLMKIRNLGHKSMHEIISKLNEIGISIAKNDRIANSH